LSPPEPPSHFDEPWQAQAFALAVALAEADVFTWPDWTRALSAAVGEIESAGRPIDARTYAEAWMSALETLVLERGALDAASIDRRTIAWRDAYRHTPHGRPVALDVTTPA
jgi:nitrile hydratase accessory protein